MRIISANLNGIRSATSKGFFDWLGQQQADVVGVQELKAQDADLSDIMRDAHGLRGHFQFAQKKGYSGVGLYTRHEPSDVITGFDGGGEFDQEGRCVELRFDRPGRRLSILSSYFPSGSSGDDRQAAKYRFLALMLPYLKALAQDRELLLMGDLNIAHREQDLKNWKGNLKNSGFLPEERQWLSTLLADAGLVDVYRALHPDTTDACYTWWSNRGQAWAKNVGWRIDYQLATPALAARARAAAIYKDERFSDHAPLGIDYESEL
ncbi:exodeoxyribonuclease III [Amphibiibacter pelophylacis]|uniref:Exodeoxyribonuclease III n=1 Tax=Amphibiibacter pelophylacis TaxID=1799477 RepID=A0ACC6P4T8_9BURK